LDSEPSSFDSKKTKKLAKTAAQATPKKGTKRFQSTDGDAGKTLRRHKKSSGTLAVEYTEKRKQKEYKTAKLKAKEAMGRLASKAQCIRQAA
jgi:hypothetical protein